VSKMEELSAKLVVDDFRDVDPETNILEKAANRSSHRIVPPNGVHNLRKDVAIQEKGKRHFSTKRQALSLQIGIELPPELVLFFRHRPVPEGA